MQSMEEVKKMQEDLKARVFISCGQQKGTDEVEIASLYRFPKGEIVQIKERRF